MRYLQNRCHERFEAVFRSYQCQRETNERQTAIVQIQHSTEIR